MGFEKQVLNVVADIVGSPRKATFAYGTLFVECGKTEADKIHHALIENFNVARVIVTRQKNGEEFSFDFAE